MTQEFSRHSIGDFCVAGLLNIIAKKGYMGKEMNAIMEVGKYKSHYYQSWAGTRASSLPRPQVCPHFTFKK